MYARTTDRYELTQMLARARTDFTETAIIDPEARSDDPRSAFQAYPAIMVSDILFVFQRDGELRMVLHHGTTTGSL